jgi:hypothetical protein
MIYLLEERKPNSQKTKNKTKTLGQSNDGQSPNKKSEKKNCKLRRKEKSFFATLLNRVDRPIKQLFGLTWKSLCFKPLLTLSPRGFKHVGDGSSR